MYTYAYGQDQQESSYADWVGGFVCELQFKINKKAHTPTGSADLSVCFNFKTSMGLMGAEVEFAVIYQNLA